MMNQSINHNRNWSYILDHLHRILIIGGSGSSKTNVLLNLINHQRVDTKKNLFVHQKSMRIRVSQLLINKRKTNRD